MKIGDEILSLNLSTSDSNFEFLFRRFNNLSVDEFPFYFFHLLGIRINLNYNLSVHLGAEHL